MCGRKTASDVTEARKLHAEMSDMETEESQKRKAERGLAEWISKRNKEARRTEE